MSIGNTKYSSLWHSKTQHIRQIITKLWRVFSDKHRFCYSFLIFIINYIRRFPASIKNPPTHRYAQTEVTRQTFIFWKQNICTCYSGMYSSYSSARIWLSLSWISITVTCSRGPSPFRLIVIPEEWQTEEKLSGQNDYPDIWNIITAFSTMWISGNSSSPGSYLIQQSYSAFSGFPNDWFSPTSKYLSTHGVSTLGLSPNSLI